MAQRISRFGIGQTAKVLGILYAIMGLVLIPFFLLGTMFAPRENSFGMGFVVALPLIYGILGYVFTAIGCAVYNTVAGWVGGIEYQVAGDGA